eukprot:scaffold25736_cov47-Phaeocystis_antarctica.AAC.1
MTPKWCGHLLPATTRPHLFDTAAPSARNLQPLSPAAVLLLSLMTHSTCFERLPRAFTEFSGCSGLGGRTVGGWRDGALRIRIAIAICESRVG